MLVLLAPVTALFAWQTGLLEELMDPPSKLRALGERHFAAEDLCINLKGVQTSVPVGYVASRRGCIRPRVWYGPESPWNTPLAEDLEVDQRSARWVSLLVESGHTININTSIWTPPVYHSARSTPRSTVTIQDQWHTYRIENVPIPWNARPSRDGGDSYMAVIDRTSRCEYDFWQMRKEPDGSWKATNQATFRLFGSGVHEPWAVRVSSFALGAGLIRPMEIEAGVMPHALAVALPSSINDPRPVPPALRSDGRAKPGAGIPVGTLFQLDPKLDLDAFRPALFPGMKVIARAMQDYGMYVADSANDAIALSAQSTISTKGYRYPWPQWGSMPKELVRHLRVVKSPVPSPRLDSWTFPGCAQRYLVR